MQRPSIKSASLAGCPGRKGNLACARSMPCECSIFCDGLLTGIMVPSRLDQQGERTLRQNLENSRPLWRNGSPPMQRLGAAGELSNQLVDGGSYAE